MKKVITICALFIGYALFAAFSAYFTATSLSLNLMRGTHFALIYILVLVVAILAGASLTMFINQIRDPHNPSKSKTILGLLGFLLFWGFSFTTNVHYFFVDKQGFVVLSRELTSCKEYLLLNTEAENRKIDDECRAMKQDVNSQMENQRNLFDRELQNTIDGHLGFGDKCIQILIATQQLLNQDSVLYHDRNKYVIWEEETDAGDRGITDRKKFPYLQKKYGGRIVSETNRKLNVIDRYYQNLKNNNTLFKELLVACDELKAVHLPSVQKDGSVSAYYKYYEYQSGKLTSQMPTDYLEGCRVYKTIGKGDKQEKKFDGYAIYPSNRMFETLTVWKDILHGYLPDYMTILQWILISLIIDIVSFVLFYLFASKI